MPINFNSQNERTPSNDSHIAFDAKVPSKYLQKVMSLTARPTYQQQC